MDVAIINKQNSILTCSIDKTVKRLDTRILTKNYMNKKLYEGNSPVDSICYY